MVDVRRGGLGRGAHRVFDGQFPERESGLGQPREVAAERVSAASKTPNISNDNARQPQLAGVVVLRNEYS